MILSIKKQLDFYVFSLGNTVKQILGKCDLVASLADSIVAALLALVYKHVFCSMQTSLTFLATQSWKLLKFLGGDTRTSVSIKPCFL